MTAIDDLIHHVASRHEQDLFLVFIGIGRARLCSDELLYLVRCEIEAILRLAESSEEIGMIDWKSVIPRIRIASNDTDDNKQWWKEHDATSQSH